ncbi:MAG: cell division protein ZipA C-terminal FtsZ-binding domain-containing protein [Chromatiales bacterium]|jgi:cell division protein ZipA|nr:cell division protein ZipA C-terminal FtsZ-binding domain-containing protein [Chromatiales bacterium]MDH4014355.1 cell division protein ZipA C-terminal FtsZ-binding domain-containing protein [Chromatiales bacterium]
MDEQLRTILLVVGVAVLALVYLWTRRTARQRREDAGLQPRQEPKIGDHALEAEDARAMPTDTISEPQEQASEVPATTDKIVSIRVAFDSGGGVELGKVAELFESAGMRFGQFDIFHYHPPDIRGTAIFSVASMVEPGTFDLDDASDRLPGVTFFMALPGPINAVNAFEKMLDTAQQLVSSLGGRLLDESGNKLSVQRIGYLRDDVISYEHQRRLQL